MVGQHRHNALLRTGVSRVTDADQQVLLFGPAVALSATLIYGFYGVMFSTGLASRGYARFWRWIEAAFGAAFSALGLTLLISGLRDLRP